MLQTLLLPGDVADLQLPGRLYLLTPYFQDVLPLDHYKSDPVIPIGNARLFRLALEIGFSPQRPCQNEVHPVLLPLDLTDQDPDIYDGMLVYNHDEPHGHCPEALTTQHSCD